MLKKSMNNTNVTKNMGRNAPEKTSSLTHEWVDTIFANCKKEQKPKITQQVFNEIPALEKKELSISRRSVQHALENIRTCMDKHEFECLMGIN